MSYLDIGFNNNLINTDILSPTNQQLDPLQAETFLPEFSGSKLSGIIQSKDSNIKLDLDKNLLSFIKGAQQILFGQLPDGSFGFQLIDQNNIKIISFTEFEKFISFDNTLLLKRADNNNLILDQNGIVSSQNFIIANYYQDLGAGIGTASTSYIDTLIDTATNNKDYPLKIILPRLTPVLILFTGRFDIDGAISATIGQAAIFVDNVEYRPSIFFRLPANVDASRLLLTTSKIITLTPGSHTITMKMKTNNAGFNIYEVSITIFSLGK